MSTEPWRRIVGWLRALLKLQPTTPDGRALAAAFGRGLRAGPAVEPPHPANERKRERRKKGIA